MYCFYGNSSWYIHGGPLFEGGPLLGGSVIGGSTVFLFFSKPAISMQERVDRLILSRNVYRVSGGVHGYQAIVSFFFLVSTVDRGALHSSR